MITEYEENSVIFENKRTEITLDELKELDSFKDYDQQQAKNLIDTMKTFARITYNIWLSEEQNNNNHQLIKIDITEPLKKAA